MINRKRPRTICFMGALLFLLTSTAPIESAVGELISKTKSSLKKGLSAAYQRVGSLKTEVLIDTLLNTIRRLGTQMGEIKDCMLYHSECTPAKRIAFIATAITILALTTAVVGFTVTVAATAKEAGDNLDRAVETTSHEVKDWRPAAVFQRLSNKLTQFKQSLLSMKQCLSKRQCTTKQKRALYATAGTIVALVTITVGVGVGSYIYAKKKEEQEILESTRQAQEQLRKTQQEQLTHQAKAEKIDPRLLEELSIDQSEEPLPAPKTTFQQSIQHGITVIKEGTNLLQQKAVDISKILQEKSKKAQQALLETVSAQKLNLFREATAALDEAKATAKNFVQEIRELSFIDTIHTVLGIDIEPLSLAIRLIKMNSINAMQLMEQLSKEPIIKQIQAFNENVTDFITKIFALMQKFQSYEQIQLDAIGAKLQEFGSVMLDHKLEQAHAEIQAAKTQAGKQKIANRIAEEAGREITKRTTAQTTKERKARTAHERTHMRQEFIQQLDNEIRELLAQQGKPVPPVQQTPKEYPFWQTVLETWNTYPRLLKQLNDLQIAGPGKLVENFLNNVASVLEDIDTITASAGTIGAKLIPDNLSTPLNILKTQLMVLGQNIKRITAIHPLINTEKAPDTFSLFYQSLAQLAAGKLSSFMKNTTDYLYKIAMQNEFLQNELTRLSKYIAPLSDVPNMVKERFLEQFKRQDTLLRNVARAPKLLLNVVGETITDVKIALDNTLESSGIILNHLSIILANAYYLLATINDFMGSTPDQPFVTVEVIERVEPIVSNADGMAQIIEKIRQEIERGREQLEQQPVSQVSTSTES